MICNNCPARIPGQCLDHQIIGPLLTRSLRIQFTVHYMNQISGTDAHMKRYFYE